VRRILNLNDYMKVTIKGIIKNLCIYIFVSKELDCNIASCSESCANYEYHNEKWALAVL